MEFIVNFTVENLHILRHVLETFVKIGICTKDLVDNVILRANSRIFLF